MVPFLRKSRLARNTVWMSLGQGLRLVIQALYFVLIARSLGAGNYGAFIGVVALVNIVYPFAPLGSGGLLIKNVARDAGLFRLSWGRALAITAVASSVLFTAVLLVSHFVLPDSIPFRLVLLVAGSDLFGLSIIQLCGQAFQAFERLHWTAIINVMSSTSRLVGALIVVAIHHHPSALQWGYLYFSSTWVVAFAAMVLVFVKLGPPKIRLWSSLAEMREGFYFSASMSAQTIYNDIDKTMLARLGTLEAAGIYGAAYRLIDVTFVPIQSLLAAAYPNFFRTGVAGITATLGYARRLVWGALAYSVAACLCILLFAGIVPLILGPDYKATAEALRWLSLLPVLKVMHYFLSDSLTGAGHQGVRTAIQAAVAVFNVLINLWIIPAYSWRGAAWSSLASDALLMCSIGAAAYILSRRAPPANEVDASLQTAEESALPVV
jgi:O-antigen/teichoic acid export membrane protein